MTKLVKWGYVLVALPLFILLGLIANPVFWRLSTLPSEVVGFLPQWYLHDQSESCNFTIPFLGSLTFMLALLIVSLYIFLWPKRYTEIDLSVEKNGKLLLKKSAIEGL